MDEKKKFWQGALCGAFAMLVVCLVISGTLVAFSLFNGQDNLLFNSDSDGIVTEETLKKLVHK